MKTRSLLPCFLALALFAACSHSMPAKHGGEGMHHRFDKPEDWAARFDDPARDGWQKPDEVLRALALPETATVADVGAATGYFSVRLARALPKGKVYGVDLEPEMVRYLDARAREQGLTNLVGVLATPDDPKLPEAVDLVLVVDTYHHIGDRPGYFRRLVGKLAPGGRVAIIDFRRGQPMGPPDEHKVPAEQVKEEMTAAGYRLEAEHPFLPNQHFLVFAPQ
ncbi:MAG: class I SAM-dependent methyltransferase [Myxococcaceae bacterium]